MTDWKLIPYSIELLGEVASGKGGEVAYAKRTHEVLPGSVVRGALARAWLDGWGPDGKGKEDFDTFFERELIVSQAVPRGMTLRAMSQRQCKYGAHEKPWIDEARTGRQWSCPHPGCESAMNAGKGWAWTGQTHTKVTTRSALTEAETADPSKLFSRRVLRRSITLSGHVLIRTGASEEAADWLQRPREFRLGGQTSHQGRARITFRSEPEPEKPGPFDPTDRVILRAQSPLLLVDQYGGPTLDPTFLLRQSWPEVKVIDSWTRPVRVEGWHAASGIPKPAEWACEAGSTFVLEGAGNPEALRLGLGLRRLEGYGETTLTLADSEECLQFWAIAEPPERAPSGPSPAPEPRRDPIEPAPTSIRIDPAPAPATSPTSLVESEPELPTAVPVLGPEETQALGAFEEKVRLLNVSQLEKVLAAVRSTAQALAGGEDRNAAVRAAWAGAWVQTLPAGAGKVIRSYLTAGALEPARTVVERLLKEQP